MVKQLEHWTCNLDYCRLNCSWSTTLVNSQLVCLRPVGILNPIMFNLNCLSQAPARATNISAINTDKGKINNRNFLRYIYCIKSCHMQGCQYGLVAGQNHWLVTHP